MRYKKQINARAKINYLIKKEHIERDICAICGVNDNIEAHHENYDEPFIIIWLCKEHHLKGDAI